jgi:hypothetical protein
MTQFTDTVSEGIGLNGNAGPVRHATSLDGGTIGLKQTEAIAWPISLAGGLGVAGALSYAYRPGAAVAEGLRLADAPTANLKWSYTVSESARMAQIATIAIPQTISQGVGLNGTLAFKQGVVLAETLGVAGALGVNSKNYLTVSQGIGLRDAVSRFFGAGVSEGIGLAGAPSYGYRPGASISEGIGLAGALSNHLIVRADISETLDVSDDQILKWTMGVSIMEGIQLSAAYIQNGTITTFAINTRTGAVTEYTNYGFNSFAKLGRNRFIAASPQGLYSLDGSDDDGTNIAARIRSGYAQFGVTRFSSLSAAYLGMHGTGNVLFKIITGEGETTVYQVKLNNMASTKVRTGKGIRARYLAFELETVGQEFDIDSVEFVPIVAQRRV